MATLYSKRFYAAQGLSGTGPSIVVPSGRVYVIKQITFYGDPTFGTLRSFLQDDGSGAALFTSQTTPGNPLWSGFYGALVFQEGQGFHFQVDATLGDGCDVYAGGYDLGV